ncbi:histidine phosphatase family protein [Pelagibius marinus]|uniref:histidine phosphatase family protein n=1 Tax=Pelagibius marinus TaxID=2762760 RepID=UPI001872DA0E|nr:histidine phosphatase family protein [Pelagibius marinus]
MSRLLLIRHGATAWNEAGRIQGRSDPPLSPAGRAAVESWRLPPEAAGARWICSPLTRARDTAEILRGAPVDSEPLLIETDWGAWEGRSLAELRDELGPDMADNEARGLDFRPPGGESPRDVQQRLRPLLTKLAQETTGSAGTVVAVTHKGVIRAVYALASGWDMRAKPPVKLRDGCAQAFTLAAGGQPAIDTLNMPLQAS